VLYKIKNVKKLWLQDKKCEATVPPRQKKVFDDDYQRFSPITMDYQTMAYKTRKCEATVLYKIKKCEETVAPRQKM
jgi:hypothetical protein